MITTMKTKNPGDVLRALRTWTDGGKHLIAHAAAPIQMRELAECEFVGDMDQLLEWVKDFNFPVGTLYVVSEASLVYDMERMRPELSFYHIDYT